MGMQALAAILATNNFVVLDTETTGLEKPAEICQIAIVDYDGAVLLDTYVNPTRGIPQAATNIHHITDATVKNAPTWPIVRQDVLEIIDGRNVIVYNATYDRKLMHWSDEAWHDARIDYTKTSPWHCAMEAYAEFYGEIHPYYGSYIWQSLTNAMIQCGLKVDIAHNALADCQMTLRLLYHCTQGL